MSEEQPAAPRGTTACPACGGKLLPIVYGLPGPEACEAAERGEIALGGCIVTGDDPRLACTACGERFGNARNGGDAPSSD